MLCVSSCVQGACVEVKGQPQVWSFLIFHPVSLSLGEAGIIGLHHYAQLEILIACPHSHVSWSDSEPTTLAYNS